MNRKTQTILRTVLLALALLNQVLTALGKNPLPIEDAQLEQLFSLALTIGASAWAWWKNNSITETAQEADAFLDSLKQGTQEVSEILIENAASPPAAVLPERPVEYGPESAIAANVQETEGGVG